MGKAEKEAFENMGVPDLSLRHGNYFWMKVKNSLWTECSSSHFLGFILPDVRDTCSPSVPQALPGLPAKI